MDTPICDFVRDYAQKNPVRLHMPAHKGVPGLGPETWDITEITGADSLYAPTGIIKQSQENASALFGCHTFYSTEGSSLCIRAMLQLLLLQARRQGKRPLIAAARNVHKSFLSGVALLDIPVKWLYSREQTNYLSCLLTAEDVENYLSSAEEKPVALYVTSPDYLGQMADIGALARVCHRYGVLLAVDNAHGAYLRFLPGICHPMELGADLCCDSAHKTLPVLTGGAYLHISPNAPREMVGEAEDALALFGSTSPSYLILESLDRANALLAGDYSEKMQKIATELATCKEILTQNGFTLVGQESLKLTVDARSIGCKGRDLAAFLEEKNFFCEFSDPDYLTLMVSPENSQSEIRTLTDLLLSYPRGPRLCPDVPAVYPCRQVMTVRQAMLAPRERVAVSQAVGRILASPSVGCPPAVPIAVCGEQIDEETVTLFQYYGIETCEVVRI